MKGYPKKRLALFFLRTQKNRRLLIPDSIGYKMCGDEEDTDQDGRSAYEQKCSPMWDMCPNQIGGANKDK